MLLRRRRHRSATSGERVHQDGAAKTLQEGLPESGGISPGVESISSWSDGKRQPQRTTVGRPAGALFSVRNTSLCEWNTGTPLREKFQKISGTHPECGSFSSAKVALPRVGSEAFNGRSDGQPRETWGSASAERGTNPGWRRVMSRCEKRRFPAADASCNCATWRASRDAPDAWCCAAGCCVRRTATAHRCTAAR